MSVEWSHITPTAAGAYWFYGDPHTDKNPEESDYIKTYFVVIQAGFKGQPFYVCDGAFCANTTGLWAKAEVPAPAKTNF